MFLGLPGSGKSFFARQLAQKTNAVRVNGDSMRLAIFGSLEEIEKVYCSEDRAKLNAYVFNAIDYAVEQILMHGDNVVYDAHHNKRVDRATLEELAKKCDALPVLVWVKTPYDIALKRGQERTAQADQRQLSEEKMREVMDRHQLYTDEPVESEHVILVDGQQTFDQQYESFAEQLDRIRKDAK